MGHSQPSIRTARAAQLPLMIPPRVASIGVAGTQRRRLHEALGRRAALDLAGYTAGANLVDAVAVEPSAGEGAFLASMIERLADSCRRLGRPISDCRHSLIAYELDEGSADRARKLAVEVLSKHGVNASTAEGLAKSWVRTGDYLFDSMAVEADFVIGNPPYVRLEEIPEETALLYRDAYPTMYGRADLYVAFFEAALTPAEAGRCLRLHLRRPLDAQSVWRRAAGADHLSLCGGCRHRDAQCRCLPR